ADGGADHRGAGAVPEQDARGPVGPVGEVGELLGPDDQRVAGGAGADRVVDGGQRVGEAGAGGVDVVAGRRLDAQLPGDPGGDVRDPVHRGAGRHHHQVDVGGGQPGAGE